LNKDLFFISYKTPKGEKKIKLGFFKTGVFSAEMQNLKFLQQQKRKEYMCF